MHRQEKGTSKCQMTNNSHHAERWLGSPSTRLSPFCATTRKEMPMRDLVAKVEKTVKLNDWGSPSKPQWPAMSTGLRISVLLASASCLLALSLRLEAATQVEGTATYEVFLKGIRRLLVEEQFCALVEGERWSINTRLVSTQPPLTRPELFCPQRQSAGSDGNDVYYLKEMAIGTGQAPVGWVEPGPVPNMAQSQTVCLFWMAYCASYYLAKAERQELRPVWGTDAGRSRRGE